MHPRLLRLTVLAGILIAGGCSAYSDPLASVLGEDGAPATESPSIRTSSAQYRVRATRQLYEVSIALTFTNPTDGAVYLPTCMGPHPPVLERWEEGEWVLAYAAVVPECLGPPVRIGQGESYDYTFRISAGRPGTNTYPRFEVEEIPGVYRLNWRVLRTWTPDGPGPGLGEPLPAALRLSNLFRLTR